MELGKYWKTIVDTLQDGLMVMDPEGNILAMNPAAERLTGYSADELLGQNCRILNCTGCELYGRGAGEDWCRLYVAGNVKAKKCLMSKKDRRALHVVKNATVLRDSEGQMIGGGPAYHSGLTGRKTGIDTYGEYARHSGAALSGKGPLRIDRVGAYMARYAAKNLVAAGLARECEVQLSYAVGAADPVSLRVRSFGGSEFGDAELTRRLREAMDFRIGAIVRDLDLKRPIYKRSAAYGHFGRAGFPWEELSRLDDFTSAVGV